MTYFPTGKADRLVPWKKEAFERLSINELVNLAMRRRAIKEPLKALLIDYLVRIGEPK